jgi:hypothetical protein
MHTYEELKEMLCSELEEITKKGELTAGSLDTVDKLTHSIKSLDTIMAMEDYSEDDYSNRGRSYDSMYERGGRMAYARKRDSMGRYSRDEVREDMISDLHELMANAPDEKTKSEFKRFITRLESM